MSAFTPSSQVIERHKSLFADKSLLVAGDIHDDYVLQLDCKQIHVHCTQFHIYSTLKSRKHNAKIEFGLQPSESAYKNIDTLIYYWPKNKVEAQFQLSYLLNALPKGSNVFIIGENRSGVKSVEGLLSNFGSINKIDSARRCGLYHFEAESRLAFDLDEWWTDYHLQIDDTDLTIYGLPGIFSQRTLDAGSDLLLNALSEHKDMIKGRVLDVGCGSGVLSAFLGHVNRNIELVSTDISAVALSSTERTLQANQFSADVIASDVFSNVEGRFNLIVSNPPFHDGKETNYNAVEALINQSKNHLSNSGKLCIVANSFLPYHRLLDENFRQVNVIAQTTKFKVYLAQN